MIQACEKCSVNFFGGLTTVITGLLLFFSLVCFSQTPNDTLKKPVKIPESDTVKDNIPSRFSEYEPNYIISNFGQRYFGQVKFKISFKFDLNIKSEIDKVYFGFSQIALWDLYEHSSPMREFDLTPVLFYEHRLNKVFSIGDSWQIKFRNYRLGYLHESNGQDGPSNRSYYKVIANADIEIARKKTKQLKFTLESILFNVRTWLWNMVDNENKNIADYRGYGQLVSTLKFDYGIKNRYRPYQIELSDVFTPAKAGLSNEVNLEFNPFIGHRDYDWIPYLHLQYFHGYAEGILNYDNRNNNYRPINTFRAGLQFRVF